MNDESASVRLDRWLFAVRIFKTRSLAARAIAGGKIKINGDTVSKAHKTVKIGDEVITKREGKTLAYAVLALLEKRVGAKDAAKCYQLTEDPGLSEEMRETIKLYRDMTKDTSKPKGRPTKRDRRLLDRLQGDD